MSRWSLLTASAFTLTVVIVASQLGAGCPFGLGRVTCGEIEATAVAGCVVIMDASGSFDPDADPITFNWSQTGGTPVTLSDASSPDPFFTAPDVASPELLSFQLVIRDFRGATDTCNVSVLVLPAPLIIADDRVCAGDTGLTASTAVHEELTYAWSIVGGTITSDPTAPAIIYNAGIGNFVELTLTVTGTTECARTVTRTVIVSPLPTPIIAPDPEAVCAHSVGNTASTPFNAGSTYAWAITGGTITAGADTNAITYTAGAGPTLELSVTETTIHGCVATATRSVVVNPLPTPVITADPEEVCAHSTGNTASTPFNDGSTYAWTITGGTITAGTDTNAITYTAGAGPLVELRVTETTVHGCSAVAPLTVLVQPLPSPAITAAAAVCALSTGNTASTPSIPGLSTFAWTITGGTITAGADTSAITYTAGTGPTVELSVTETTIHGCVTTATRSVTVHPLPTPVITLDPEEVCAESTGNAASTPLNAGSTYAWTITGGTITTGANTNAITYTAGTGPTLELRVTETTAQDCSVTVTRLVTVHPRPVPVITADPDPVCAFSAENSASTPLNAGSTYAWTITGGTIMGAADTNEVLYEAGEGPTLELRVTETTAEGCEATAVLTITVNPLPTPVITADEEVCAFSEANTASTPLNSGSTYFWTILGGTIESGQGTNQISYEAGGGPTVELSVTETDENGCSATAFFTVTVAVAPSITSGPTDETAQPGDEVVFSVTATGTAVLMYQWQVDEGEGFGNMLGETDPTLTVIAREVDDGIYRSYRVIVSNECGSVTSDPATLFVTQACCIEDGSDFVCQDLLVDECLDADGFAGGIDTTCDDEVDPCLGEGRP